MNLDRLRLTLTAIWMGLMCSFSLITAPAAFSVLPDQRLSGAVVTRTLAITETTGIIIGLLLISSWIVSWRKTGELDWSSISVTLLMTISMIVARLFVATRLHEIRLMVNGEIALLAAEDPLRIKFNLLHRISVWLMGGAMTGALLLIIRELRHER